MHGRNITAALLLTIVRLSTRKLQHTVDDEKRAISSRGGAAVSVVHPLPRVTNGTLSNVLYGTYELGGKSEGDSPISKPKNF